MSSHFVVECVRRGVIAFGDLNGIRGSIVGPRLNQRLQTWPYLMLKYKEAPAGILVRDNVDEKSTSALCHTCGEVALLNLTGDRMNFPALEGLGGCKECSENLQESVSSISCEGE